MYGLLEGYNNKRCKEYSSDDENINIALEKYNKIFNKTECLPFKEPEIIINEWQATNLYLKQFARKITRSDLPKVSFSYYYSFFKFIKKII